MSRVSGWALVHLPVGRHSHHSTGDDARTGHVDSWVPSLLQPGFLPLASIEQVTLPPPPEASVSPFAKQGEGFHPFEILRTNNLIHSLRVLESSGISVNKSF